MIHRDVARSLFITGIITAVCGIFGWVGMISPESLGWPSKNPLIVNIILAVLGCGVPLLWFLACRLHLRSLWVYQYTSPVTMYLQINVEKDNESTNYYALLRTTPNSKEVKQIPVYVPQWLTESVESNTPARVFVDPKSAKPLVIETKGGRLWTMAL